MPAGSVCQQAGISETLLGPFQTIADQGIEWFGHRGMPCARTLFANGVAWCQGESQS